MMSCSKSRLSLVALLGAAILSCSEDASSPGEGTLNIELYGEAFIEDGIPAAASPSDEGFVDGYAVTFDTFLIALSNISAAANGEAPELSLPGTAIWNLTEPGPFDVTSGTVSAGVYDHTVYAISPPDDTATSGNVEDDVVDAMVARGYSIVVAGSATDGTVTKTFEWGFDTSTEYDPCHSEAELEDGGSSTIQITIHGDHLFYDSAVSSEPSLRFEEIALADADGDDIITADELADYDIGGSAYYQVGNLEVSNLWDYLSHMTSTLGHIDGEGHCE